MELFKIIKGEKELYELSKEEGVENHKEMTINYMFNWN